ncbi:stage II sporulation protein AA (anti-sigma F factor antagonist) [Actinopolymorpha cephalotaxi]|uniref:Anti-sigma factor antagonist n=1 Tax=Actinopolymorpha cephalotaxi TaxID=504797 RepID=A0A1I2PGI9_9ACTN|nr:STAS domain-containing protein [Actinopolymorpha cephalotaxi]NYH83614.1 stage II sporulation protein AA (anti-sigma F factor antagonist) [Actinopolymorpha cephalotaxi]SFG15265.1 stage II sporulation protein AA (anti-sigma F factor antagonist) [Actinopolymorpha cephalotaxi]
MSTNEANAAGVVHAGAADPRIRIDSTHTEAGTLVTSVTGEVDQATSAQLCQELNNLLDEHPAMVVLSLEDVPFLDSGGLDVLVNLQRRAHAEHVPVRICAPRRGPTKLLHLTGLDVAFDIYPTVKDALAGTTNAGSPFA